MSKPANSNSPSLTAGDVAKALGGQVVKGNQVLAPGPGHSFTDKSLSVWIDPTNPAGFRVHSHAGDDAMACRDYVRERLGLEPFGSERNIQAPKSRPHRRQVAQYVYRRPGREPFALVTRWEPKSFSQSRWTGSAWENGKPEGGKLPYRLPEMMAKADEAVFICEGEKDADRLAGLGFLTTSATEGAGKWTPDLATWFIGRMVFVLPDNDRAGEDHAQLVARSLHPVAREVRVVRLPGLKDKGDVSDWIDAGGDADALQTLCRAAPLWGPGEAADAAVEGSQVEGGVNGLQAAGVPFTTAADLLCRPMKPRQFLAGDTMPLGQVTDLRGDGKTGKSTLGIQLCVATVTGRAWLDMDVQRGSAVYLASEDDADEVQRRLHAIATHYAVPDDALSNLHVWPLATDDPALVVLEGGKLKHTARWRMLEAKVEAVRPVVVVLDSRADVFAGEEMNRNHVRAFIAMLRALAVKSGAAVVMLSHPSLSGMASGTGNSGSTHWANAARAVLYLRRPKEHDDQASDPDARVLEFSASNYSAGGAAPLQLRWSAGAFVVAEGGRQRGANRVEAEAEVDQMFLALLAKVSARGMRVSPTPCPTYAPKAFEREEGNKGIRAKAFETAMRRLIDRGAIAVAEDGSPSKRRQFLTTVKGNG